MSEEFISRGFRGRRQQIEISGRLPPGQYLERGFPVLSAGPNAAYETFEPGRIKTERFEPKGET